MKGLHMVAAPIDEAESGAVSKWYMRNDIAAVVARPQLAFAMVTEN